MPLAVTIRRRLRSAGRKWREAGLFARAMHSKFHPILAQIVPVRRCNLSCIYCNEFDSTSRPVALDEMLRRIDRLAALGTTIVTISGGEPMLHPGLEAMIGRIRYHGAMATLITNGYLLTPDRIHGLNRAGLDYLQISIDNVQPDRTSKKSLKVLDRKLQWLAVHAEFSVTVNSVLGSYVRTPEDAVEVTRRARELGFNSTVGIIHDGHGQSSRLPARQIEIYEELRKTETGVFSFAHYDRFQRNLVQGIPNQWHCRAGGRFLYVCEDGLVHYCSQRRGAPGIPLAEYTREHLEREFHAHKGCEPLCGISCVHQTAMLDEVREHPRQMLSQLIERRRTQDPGFRTPLLLRAIAWAFLDNPQAAAWSKAALRLLGAARKP